MKGNKHYSIGNKKYARRSYLLKNLTLILLSFAGVFFYPTEIAKSEELFLTCTGKFEINRGALIRPDWEISYITINLKGLNSSIYEKEIKKEARAVIRGDTYTITHRDIRKRITSKYKINVTHGTYIVIYPQRNRSLIGTCEKGKG